MEELNKYNTAYVLQKHVCDILNADEALSGLSATFYPENSMDIDYEIRNSIARQGIACVVMTPTLTYEGHNGIEQEFTVNDLTLQVVENPTINRSRLKKLGLSAGTALDICNIASRRLAGPQGGHFGEFTTQTIEQGEDEGLIVAKATFGCTFYQDLSGVLSGDLSGNWIYLPYAYQTDLSALSIAIEADIPKKVSQLSNDAGYITSSDIPESDKLYAPDKSRYIQGDLEVYQIVEEVEYFEVSGNYFLEDEPTHEGAAREWVCEDPNEPEFKEYITVSEPDEEEMAVWTFWRADGTEVNKGGESYMPHSLRFKVSNNKYIYATWHDEGKITVYDGHLARTNQIPTKTSDLINDSSFATTSQIPTKVSQLANDKSYATTSQIPTKTSQLTNDSGYLTQHQSLSNCVTLTGSQTITGAKTFNDTLTLGSSTYLKFDGSKFTEIQAGDKDGTTRPLWMIDHGIIKWFASTDEIPTKTSQLSNNSGYTTESWVKWWAGTQNYATKGNTTLISEFFNDRGYVTQSQLPDPKKLYSPDESQYIQGNLEIYTIQAGSSTAYWNISNSPNNGYYNNKHLEETDDVSKFSFGPPPDKAWSCDSGQTDGEGDASYIYLYKVSMDESNTLWFLCWETTLLCQVMGSPSDTQLIFSTDMGSFTFDLTTSSSEGGPVHSDDIATKSYVDGLVGNIETILAEING